MSDKTTKSPQIRFAGFTDAWEQRKLGDLIEQVIREIPKPDTPYERLSVRSHAKGTFHQYVDDPNTVAMEKLYVVRKKDLVVNITFAWEHAIAVAKESDDGLLVSHRFPTYRADGKSDIEFLNYLVSQEKFREKLELISPGGAGRNRVLNKKDFLKIEVVVPKNIEEQTKIGNLFVQLDETITLHQSKLELLKRTKKSLLQKMFPKDGANVPEIRFAGFTDAWEQRKYGEVIDLLSGQDFSPSEYNDTGNGIPYMTGASCIVGKETIVNRWTTVPRCLAEKGDVLLVCKGSGYGTIAVMAQDKAHIARQFMALKNLPNLDKVFNFYLLNSVIESIKKDARGLIAGIARDAVIKQEISIPLLAEQQKIGSFFNQLDNLITLHQHELNSLKNFKKSLTQKMFI